MKPTDAIELRREHCAAHDQHDRDSASTDSVSLSRRCSLADVRTREGEILVQLPGVDDPARVKADPADRRCPRTLRSEGRSVRDRGRGACEARRHSPAQHEVDPRAAARRRSEHWFASGQPESGGPRHRSARCARRRRTRPASGKSSSCCRRTRAAVRALHGSERRQPPGDRARQPVAACAHDQLRRSATPA